MTDPTRTLAELARQWRSQQAVYPLTSEGQYAAAAVRCCANELDAALAALVPPPDPEIRRLKAAISPTHAATWSLSDLTMLARAHRQDSENVDGGWVPDGETDYDAIRLARQQRLLDVEAQLAALRAQIAHVVQEMRAYGSDGETDQIEQWADALTRGLAG